MNLLFLLCLGVIVLLLLADRVLLRRASVREQRHRARLREREQRLRADWHARQPPS